MCIIYNIRSTSLRLVSQYVVSVHRDCFCFRIL